MFDNLQVICWTIVYTLIVFFSLWHKEDRRFLIPPIAMCLNLACEINAIIYTGGSFWGHYLWLSLDIVIFIIALLKIRCKKLYILVCTLAILTLFLRILFTNGYMLISCFIIDLLMAVEFVISINKLSSYGKIPIAIFKLLGDTFAWIFYMKASVIVAIIGGLVLPLNLLYLFVSVKNIKLKVK